MPVTREPGSYFVGLMSGTSMDGIDAALVEFGDHSCSVIATSANPYPDSLRQALLHASRTPAECTVDKIGQLDHWIGECFRDAANSLLSENEVDRDSVTAIGSHGQTLRHQPRAARPFTLQIGDPNLIATGTGITTVADFRRRDIADGGEGAPLAPAFHQWLFADPARDRVVLNIGGIANATVLPASGSPVVGFDTGPGNTLLDGWIRQCRDLPFDDGGSWSNDGNVSEPLLEVMLADPYFSLAPPKSTGFEYFNGAWTRNKITSSEQQVAEQDVQSTLAELSARTIAVAILEHAPAVEELLVCGGGVRNMDLMQRLSSYVSGTDVRSTEHYGLHADWVEAAAFAWLAKRRLDRETGNLPEVTGAASASVLGAIYSA
jgi:anhydro-N-acetylmuramic acid kinase